MKVALSRWRVGSAVGLKQPSPALSLAEGQTISNLSGGYVPILNLRLHLGFLTRISCCFRPGGARWILYFSPGPQSQGHSFSEPSAIPCSVISV